MNDNVPIVSIKNITKHFGGVHALSDVGFDIGEGECHALVGENGAGKTTLINILSGDMLPDAGHIEVGGTAYHRLDPRTSISLGINVIHQELALIGPLSVMENIFVGDLQGRCRGFVKSQRRLKADAQGLLDMLGCDVRSTDLVERLSTSKKQIVEIAKALSTNPKILIMDEPTSSLTKGETEKLFQIIGSLKAKGISIVFVSHRLNEVMEVSDRVTVLRDGRYIGTVKTGESSVDAIVGMMVGRKIELYQKLVSRKADNPVYLEVKGLSREPYFRNVGFQARSGEILTFSGLVGAGRTELAESIFGFVPPETGEIRLFGERRRISSPKEAMNLGIGLLTEDRKVNGVIGTMVVRENASVAVLPRLARAGFVRRREENALVRNYIDLLAIKTPSIENPIMNLSGGNQQKVMIARWLAAKVKVLIVDEPTQGVDVGAKAEIHKLLRELAGQGVAVVVISSDLPEVLSISDRILIMRSGEIVGELESGVASEERIMKMATVGRDSPGGCP